MGLTLIEVDKRGAVQALILFILILTVLVPFSSVHTTRASDLEDASRIIKKYMSGGINLRFRNELWRTFEKQGEPTDRTYDFFLLRARGFIDFDWENINIHIMAQGVQALNLPTNAAAGLGPLYFTASGNKTDPGNLQIAEAYLKIKDLNGFYLRGGRIALDEGAEVLYQDAKIDWLIKNRLSERLIGNWDWTAVGRRFDGATLGYANSVFDLNLFGAYVTFGGFDIDDGLWKDLDTVIVAGGSFTIKKGVLLPNTQFKIFNYFYFDDRTAAVELAGNALKINTIGANVVGAYFLGPGQMDLLLWFAFQFGKFGDLDQRAIALIAEAGYQLLDVPLKPWLRAGFALSTGDGDPDDSDNGTFYNMVPTNHKWYGQTDTVAFMNLITPYFELFLTPHKNLRFKVDGHLFWLASDDEFWISGSGPFNNDAFGYIFREPVEGKDIERNLGGELGFTLNWTPIEFLDFDIGYYHWFGGKGVRVVFDKRDDQDWFYVQSTIHFSLFGQ